MFEPWKIKAPHVSIAFERCLRFKPSVEFLGLGFSQRVETALRRFSQRRFFAFFDDFFVGGNRLGDVATRFMGYANSVTSVLGQIRKFSGFLHDRLK